MVKQIILEHTEFKLDEYGDLPDKDDFWSLDFFGYCFFRGRENSKLYGRFCSDRHLNDKIMKLLERIIKVVINYEE